MDLSEFVARFSVLFHLTERSNLEGASKRGLLSTTALLDLFEVAEHRRETLESRRREHWTTLSHPEHGTAHVRDQLAIKETVLRKSLSRSERGWYRLLNSRVFLWPGPSRVRLNRTLAAYSDRRNVVLTFDTNSLVRAHERCILLTRFNAGSTGRGAGAPRGPNIFFRIDEEQLAIMMRAAGGRQLPYFSLVGPPRNNDLRSTPSMRPLRPCARMKSPEGSDKNASEDGDHQCKR